MHYTSIITNGGQHKLGLPNGSWDEVCGDPWIGPLTASDCHLGTRICSYDARTVAIPTMRVIVFLVRTL